MPEIPSLRRLTDLDFRTSLGYVVKNSVSKRSGAAVNFCFLFDEFHFFNVYKDTNKNPFSDSDKNSS